MRSSFFFFNDTATTEIYTLSLHDALPIWSQDATGYLSYSFRGASTGTRRERPRRCSTMRVRGRASSSRAGGTSRSEEHTSELQSRQYLVCRLLLEKKKNNHPLQ